LHVCVETFRPFRLLLKRQKFQSYIVEHDLVEKIELPVNQLVG